MSALPRQVQRQIDEANRIADQVYGRGEKAPAAAETPAEGAPPAETPPAEEAQQAAPAAVAQPAPAAAPSADEWKQKYLVLQGKYNAEVPRLGNQLREQGGQLQALQEQLSATQHLLASFSQLQQSAAAAADPRAPAADGRLVKDEEIREFGPDLIDVMRRVAREEGVQLLPEIDRRVQPIAQRVDQVTQATQAAAQRIEQNDRSSVVQMLDDQIQDWRVLNEDPGFLNWLSEIDPYSNMQRGVMLRQAHAKHDGTRVVAFFRGYLNEHAAVAPSASPAVASSAAPQRKLEDLVAPGTPKSGAAGTPDGSGKRVYTRADIGRFYADRSAGKYRTQQKRADEIERDIFAAQAEGRIR